MTANLAVIVVNWNGGRGLHDCIKALLVQTRAPDRILIVDNGSSDGSLDALPGNSDVVEMLRLGHNAGFARANNIALQKLKDFHWIALLNPDAFPEPDWLERLMSAVTAHPEYSSFSSRMLSDADIRFLDGAGDVYHCTGLPGRRGYGCVAEGRYIKHEETFSACAGAALYRRSAFLDAGGFDNEYFCFLEDVDLGFRLRLLGHRCLYVSDAVVRHVGSSSTGLRSDFSVYHGHRNLVWTFVKSMPLPLLALFAIPHLLMNLATVVYFILRGRGRVILRAKWDAILGLRRIWRQRREIQRQRTVPLSALLRVMSFGWPRTERF